MINENIAVAKAKLSSLVNAALDGEEVLLCKDGVPAVRLVPVHPASHADPCRAIARLTIEVGDEALKPLESEDWGELAQ